MRPGPLEGEGLARAAVVIAGELARLLGNDVTAARQVANIPSWEELSFAEPRSVLEEIRDRSLLRRSQLERLEAAYDSCSDWHVRTEAPAVICHGDLHLNNVLATHN